MRKSLIASDAASEASAAPGDISSYVVQSGDSLSRIAARHGTTVTNLRKLNGIEGDFLKPGQVLKISASFTADFPCLASCESDLTAPKINRKRWQKLILHHSATDMGSARSFGEYHRKVRGMTNGLAYHFVIGNGKGSPDGTIEVGERWAEQIQGGHVKSFALNEISIGICFVGNFEKNRPTAKQLAAAEDLVRYLTERALPGRLDICVHRDVESTLCPGRLFPTERFTRAKA